MTATWSTAEIRADRLAVGDLYDRGGLMVPVRWVESEYNHTQVRTDAHTFQVPRDSMIPVHVPDKPLDGYNLWRRQVGTWPYSQCTCVHRRTDRGWEPITNDCPACAGRATDDWSD